MIAGLPSSWPPDKPWCFIAGGIDLSVTAVIGLTSVLGAPGDERGRRMASGSLRCHPGSPRRHARDGRGRGTPERDVRRGLRMPPFGHADHVALSWGLAIWLAQHEVHAEKHLPSSSRLPPPRQPPWVATGVAIAAAVAMHLLMTRTLLGRWFRAVGHNPRTAFIRVPGGTVVTAYVLSGLMAALTSVPITACLETGSPSHGRTLLLDVIGAAVIGGTSLSEAGEPCPVPPRAFCSSHSPQRTQSAQPVRLFITMVKGVVILWRRC